MGRITRREALAGIAGAALAASVARAAGMPMTLVEPYGEDSSTHKAASLLGPPLARIIGAPVSITQIAGEAGGRALAHVAAAAPDGGTQLVTQLLSPYIDAPAGSPGTPSYRAMTPVARLTPGMSTALVAAHGSDIADWATFARRVETGRLRVAHNPILLFALPLAMLEAQFGRVFDDVLASTRAEMNATLDGGEADVGFLPTISLLTADGRPPLRPIVTFGGTRNQWFPDVPNYREVGQGSRTAITGAIVMFAPPGMPSERRAGLVDALRAAGDDEQARQAAAALRYPLRVDGPGVLIEEMDRCARVIRDMAPYLRAPNWRPRG